jgi:N-acetylglucosamine-6-sulfatase
VHSIGVSKAAGKWLGLLTLIIPILGAAHAAEAQEPPTTPDILFILTDDQQESTLEHMPNLQREFSQGTTFANTVNVWPLCCPSRTTILRGQYAHNHGVTDN